jgi:hypothetical protein
MSSRSIEEVEALADTLEHVGSRARKVGAEWDGHRCEEAAAALRELARERDALQEKYDALERYSVEYDVLAKNFAALRAAHERLETAFAAAERVIDIWVDGELADIETHDPWANYCAARDALAPGAGTGDAHE